MSRKQHAPTPWRWMGDGYVRDANSYRVAVVDLPVGPLIAAAPDLLAALKDVLSATQEMADSYAVRTRPFDAAAQYIENAVIRADGAARAAIAKAEGR